MNDLSYQNQIAASQESGRPEYVAPVVRVMNETEVLSAFQVNAAGTMGWWVA
jgi:hypothetical protein